MVHFTPFSSSSWKHCFSLSGSSNVNSPARATDVNTEKSRAISHNCPIILRLGLDLREKLQQKIYVSKVGSQIIYLMFVVQMTHSPTWPRTHNVAGARMYTTQTLVSDFSMSHPPDGDKRHRLCGLPDLLMRLPEKDAQTAQLALSGTGINCKERAR